MIRASTLESPDGRSVRLALVMTKEELELLATLVSVGASTSGATEDPFHAELVAEAFLAAVREGSDG